MQSALRRTLRQSQFYTQTVKATTLSETPRPKVASLDAVSRATHIKTISILYTHHPTPKR